MIISIGRKLTCNLVLILTPDQPFDQLYSQWEYGLTLTGDGRRSSMIWLKTDLNCNFACADPEGGGVGVRTPWKITSYMGFFKYYDKDPPPGKSWTPPPPGKCQTPSGSSEKYSFLCNQTIGPPLYEDKKIRCPFLAVGHGPPPLKKKFLDPNMLL